MDRNTQIIFGASLSIMIMCIAVFLTPQRQSTEEEPQRQYEEINLELDEFYGNINERSKESAIKIASKIAINARLNGNRLDDITLEKTYNKTYAEQITAWENIERIYLGVKELARIEAINRRLDYTTMVKTAMIAMHNKFEPATFIYAKSDKDRNMYAKAFVNHAIAVMQ